MQGGGGAPAARVAAGEEGLLRLADQGGDRRGLRRHPRHAPATPAQEAAARRAAPARRKDHIHPRRPLRGRSDARFWVPVLNSAWFCLELQMLYPGLSLADVNLDSYKIEEVRNRCFTGVFPTSFPQSWFFSSCAFFPRAEVIGAVVELQIGGTFRMCPAFAFFLRWRASSSHNYSSSC